MLRSPSVVSRHCIGHLLPVHCSSINTPSRCWYLQCLTAVLRWQPAARSRCRSAVVFSWLRIASLPSKVASSPLKAASFQVDRRSLLLGCLRPLLQLLLLVFSATSSSASSSVVFVVESFDQVERQAWLSQIAIFLGLLYLSEPPTDQSQRSSRALLQIDQSQTRNVFWLTNQRSPVYKFAKLRFSAGLRVSAGFCGISRVFAGFCGFSREFAGFPREFAGFPREFAGFPT